MKTGFGGKKFERNAVFTRRPGQQRIDKPEKTDDGRETNRPATLPIKKPASPAFSKVKQGQIIKKAGLGTLLKTTAVPKPKKNKAYHGSQKTKGGRGRKGENNSRGTNLFGPARAPEF